MSQNYFQLNNGQSVFCRRLASGLAERGHEVTALSPSDRGEEYRTTTGDCQVIAIHSTPLRPWYSDVYVTFRPRAALARAIAAAEPDIIHLQDHFPLCRSAAQIASNAGLPMVATNHFLPENIIPFVPVLGKLGGTRASLERLLWRQVKKVFCRARAATAPSETAAEILRWQNIGIPVRAISCGVDASAFHPGDAALRGEVRTQYGLRTDRPLMLFVGRVDREKRLDTLLDALAAGDMPDIQLGIVGKGHDLAGLRARAQKLNLGDRVVFLGFIPDGALSALLGSADFFAMPSEAELQSIATLEAMACGLPVLASDARALPELVKPGVNGLLFRSGDSADCASRIKEMVQRRGEWPRMARQSLAVAGAHTVERTVERYEALYCEVLKEPLTNEAGCRRTIISRNS